MSKDIESRLQVFGPILVRAFIKHGLPGVWGLAIAHQESKFVPTERNLKGGDGDLGGAWGLCQVTMSTARKYDPAITPERLLIPETNAEIAARICADNNKRIPGDFANVLAWYNDGKPLASRSLAKDTREKYIPAVLGNAQKYADAAERIEKTLITIPAKTV